MDKKNSIWNISFSWTPEKKTVLCSTLGISKRGVEGMIEFIFGIRVDGAYSTPQAIEFVVLNLIERNPS